MKLLLVSQELLHSLNIPLLGKSTPQDLRIIGGGYDYDINCMYLILESEDFPHVPEGIKLPRIQEEDMLNWFTKEPEDVPERT